MGILPRVLVRWAPLILVFAFAPLLSGCKNGAAQAEPSASAKPSAEPGVDVELKPEAMKAAKIAVAPSRKVPRLATLVAVGTLDLSPKRVAKVGAPVEGRISAVRVQLGDKVRAGDVLAVLDSGTIGRAKAEYFQAEARLKQAEKELAREKQLTADGVSTQRAVAQAQVDRDVAASELRAASERLRAVGASPGGSSASPSLALSAPLAGVILTAKPRVGEAVAPADTLYTVGDLSELWLMVEVYERDLHKVRAGDAVRVEVIAAPGKVFSGTVDHILETIDPMRRAADVRIVLPNADGALRPGMSATARIMTSGNAKSDKSGGKVEDAVVVPKDAVQLIDGLSHVFVEKAEGKFELRVVELGPAIEGDVEIARGLDGGERVVVDGAFILKSQVLKEQMGSND